MSRSRSRQRPNRWNWKENTRSVSVTMFITVAVLSTIQICHGLVVPSTFGPTAARPVVIKPAMTTAFTARKTCSRLFFANTLDDIRRNATASSDDDDDDTNRNLEQISVSTGRFLKKTRPVRFIMTPDDLNDDDDEDDKANDPLTRLERNQQELSLSLGKLKASLQQEQRKSQTLQERLEEAERIIAYQKEKLERTTLAQQQELKALDQQLAQSLLEQQQQQQELLLKKAKQEAAKEQQQLLRRVQQLQANLDVATQDLQSTNREIADLSRELNSAQSEINQLSNRLESAQSKERNYQTTLQKLQEKLGVARGKLGVKQETLSKTQRELAQAKAKLDLQEKLSGGNGSTPAAAAAATTTPPPIFGAAFNLGGSGVASTSSKSTRPPTAASARAATPPVVPNPIANKVFVYPVINNWSINENSGEVTGIVQNHPDIDDGTRIVTSALANPKQASVNAVVVTKSGSKYKLGTPSKSQPKANVVSTPPPQVEEKEEIKLPSFNFFGTSQGSSSASTSASKNAFNQPPPPKTRAQELQQRYPQLEFPLTGESISNGRGTKYLLAGKPKRKPSGRSEIIMAYKANAQLEPIGEAVAVKLSTHKDKLDREYNNYQRIQKGAVGGWGANTSGSAHAFVKCYDFLPVLEGSFKYAQHSALVLERGVEDLREYKARHGTMDDATTKAALSTAIKCVESLHKARLVYTDLKAENLITMEQGDSSANNDGILFKGVDLESAIPHRGHPLDYTPEASPPEFAVRYLEGEAYDFILEYSYDIWSFGMLAYELGTGKNFFSKKQPAQIMKQLGMGVFEPPNVEAVIDDGKLCDLINKCLHLDPKQRPTATQVTNHPYFKGESPRLFGW
ncbi:serine/threonine protein kinase [Nitzschia inconspicua]|uniref:Serine/threonine protein kinase n=1 Tax=Nitzschia inconspicua TaxID=303405 RepID=A0A9K3KJ14_9STRA|nr:serine/threonine protein kinase [Nitzschia inconspicua]